MRKKSLNLFYFALLLILACNSNVTKAAQEQDREAWVIKVNDYKVELPNLFDAGNKKSNNVKKASAIVREEAPTILRQVSSLRKAKFLCTNYGPLSFDFRLDPFRANRSFLSGQLDLIGLFDVMHYSHNSGDVVKAFAPTDKYIINMSAIAEVKNIVFDNALGLRYLFARKKIVAEPT